MQDFTRRLLAEQNDMYEVSLAADRERAQRVEEESRKAEEERKALEEAEEKARRARREAKRGALPAEPALDAAGGVALVRVRLPDGSNCSRRFLGSHTIGHVFDLVYSLESTNYAKFDLVNNCPRQVYSSPDFGTIHSLCECPAFCPCRFDLVNNCPRFGLVSNYPWQVYSSPECGTRHNLCDFLPFALAGSSSSATAPGLTSSATAPGEFTAHMSSVQETTYASVLPFAHAGSTSSATTPDKFDLVSNCPRREYSSPQYNTQLMFDIVSNYPRQVYTSPEHDGTTLEAAGFVPTGNLFVQPVE
eukprot:gene7583-738_t